ncbi:MAG: HAD family hydrolase [Muribaculaceae bacterium]|nr:HAD family hydrolase [Muribaculaceae bacterium]
MKVVGFDLDDTLYKELDYVKSAFKAICTECSLDKADYNYLLRQWKAGENQFDALLSKYPHLSLSRLLQIYRYHKPDIKLDIPTVDLLENLKIHADTRIVLISDGRSETQRNKIESLGLNKYIAPQDIIISEEIGSEKNNIQNFKYFEDTYPQCQEFYYIGDNPRKDFYQANMLGWTTIQLNDNGQNIHTQDCEVLHDYCAKLTINSIDEAYQIIA